MNFRLTESEYQDMKLACELQGARNLSDYARLAVLGRQSSGLADTQMQGRLIALESRVQALELSLLRLSSALNREDERPGDCLGQNTLAKRSV